MNAILVKGTLLKELSVPFWLFFALFFKLVVTQSIWAQVWH